MMYAKSKELMAVFDCSKETVTKVRKFIAENPERYTQYGVIKNLTSMLAFADAYRYRDADLNTVPPFDPEAVARMIGGTHGQL